MHSIRKARIAGLRTVSCLYSPALYLSAGFCWHVCVREAQKNFIADKPLATGLNAYERTAVIAITTMMINNTALIIKRYSPRHLFIVQSMLIFRRIFEIFLHQRGLKRPLDILFYGVFKLSYVCKNFHIAR